MTFPAGRYITLESIEVTPEHVLEVEGSDFIVVHSRACTIREGGGLADGVKGALICILVKEGAQVTTHRNGRIKYRYPKKEE